MACACDLNMVPCPRDCPCACHKKISQIGWTPFRRGLSWSVKPAAVHRRFVITRTSSGFTVADKQLGDLTRVTTFALAKAWAGIRVNEQCVRHESTHHDHSD